MAYPPQVEALKGALERIAGVHEVSVSVERVGKAKTETLGSPEAARLPHAALRRTGGAFDDEALVQVEFWVERSETGWRALEFIAWIVRDMARSGDLIQLRPFALPPLAPHAVQLGRSLRFHVDLFIPETGGEVQAHIDKLGDLAGFITMVTDMYDEQLVARGQPGLVARG